MHQEQQTEAQAEQTAVPDVDVVGETVQDLSEAGARILPHKHQAARPADRPGTQETDQPATQEADQPRRARGETRQPGAQGGEEEHVGGARGPQDPGPWGSDEAVRAEPAWGSAGDSPMDEGSE